MTGTPFAGGGPKAIDRNGLIENPKFNTMEARTQNHKELFNILAKVFVEKTIEQWIKIFSSVDFPFYPVNRITDLANDPQVVANGYLLKFDHPVLGKVTYPGMPYHFSESTEEILEPAPQFGQHTELILSELLGYSWEEIGEMQSNGIL